MFKMKKKDRIKYLSDRSSSDRSSKERKHFNYAGLEINFLDN